MAAQDHKITQLMHTVQYLQQELSDERRKVGLFLVCSTPDLFGLGLSPHS
jgi:hypothetical protein